MKIEVTEEQYEAFQNGESITLVPPKKEHVIEYNASQYIIAENAIKGGVISRSDRNINHGRYRKTSKNAEYSLKRNQRANRLEALVEDLQGELGVGNYVVYEFDNGYGANEATFFNVGDVRMNKTTAEKVCELLNSGQYSLEG